jgi:FAD/FMN-containing dehydrogenase
MEVMTETLDVLRDEARGAVLAPGDAGYDGARALWNGMIDLRPAVLVQPESADDVAAAIRFARERGLTVTARGGGHGVAGNALTDGGLVVDLRRLKSVEVDPVSRTVRAGGGVTLGELDAATQAHGLATPLGVVTKTGIAGLTLSGGIGWLRRKHGLSADNLVSLEVVVADGRVLTASETENAELFWALRGGGGSFGVVTELEYRLHQVGPDVAVAFVLYPGKRAAEVLRAVDEYTSSAPEDVSPLAFLGHVPAGDPFPVEAHGLPYVAVAAVHPGEVEEGELAVS